jgi:hypothetical protein
VRRERKLVTAGHPADFRVTVPPDVLVRVINGESFILNVQTECYFGLNAVGSRMFQVLSENPSFAAALEQLHGEYEVDAEILRGDFERLVTELLANGLLERVDHAPAPT